MITRKLLWFAMMSYVVIALSGNGFAEMITYSSTYDGTNLSMPSDQGWTQVGTWEAVYEGTAYSVVDPNPGHVAHGSLSAGASTYIFQELTSAQEAAALANGWTLTLQARLYQTWGAGFGAEPEDELGFGVKTSGGDTMVGQKLQRDTSAGKYAAFVALFGGDGEGGIDKVETPRLNNAEGDTPLSPTYINYQLSYDPASGEATLTARDSRSGVDNAYTISNTLAPNTGLSTGETAVVYVGTPSGAVSGGHMYIDSVTFEINEVPEPSTLMMLICGLLGIGWIRCRRSCH